MRKPTANSESLTWCTRTANASRSPRWARVTRFGSTRPLRSSQPRWPRSPILGRARAKRYRGTNRVTATPYRVERDQGGRAERERTVEQRVLVERARRDDHDAFAELVGAAITRLDASARLILRDRELARDAVQEALIRAWRDLPGLRDSDRFDAWLHRLTVHACLDLVRRRRRRPVEVELSPLDLDRRVDQLSDLALRDELDRAMARLEPEQRAVIVLRFYVGLPLPEAASSLGIPLGTAKSRLHRAIASLRRTVELDETSPELEGGRAR